MLSSNTPPIHIFLNFKIIKTIFKKIKNIIFKKSPWNLIRNYRLQNLSLIVLYSYILSNLLIMRLPTDLKNKFLISRKNKTFYLDSFDYSWDNEYINMEMNDEK